MASNMGRPNSVDILGVSVDMITMAEALKEIADWVGGGDHTPHYIVKPYVEFMTAAQSEPNLRDILNQADLSVADGVSLQWAASFLYGQPYKQPTLHGLVWSALWRIQQRDWREQVIREKFAGVNFTAKLLELAAHEGWRIGILGGPRDTEQTKIGLKAQFPNLNLQGVWSGFTPAIEAMDFNQAKTDQLLDKVLTEISSARLDILFVALGFPRQELFIDHYLSSLGVKVMIGEGGSFDYDQLGGKLKRAPQLVRKLSLEWLWRLMLQPGRIMRQLAVPKFTWRVYRQARQQWRPPNQEK